MGADDNVWQGAAIAQVDHVLSRDSEESRDLSRGEKPSVHVPMIEDKHQKHNRCGVVALAALKIPSAVVHIRRARAPLLPTAC